VLLSSVLNPSNSSATPDPAAPTQVPAFAGVSAVADAPLTSGIVPTTTFVPATIPLNGGAFAAVPTAALILAGGAAVLAANL
jgi:hypothetical protein